MNILYDYEIFARQRYGGVSRYFYEIISGIADGYKPEIDVFLGLNITGYDFKKLKELVNIKRTDLNYPVKLHFVFHLLNKRSFNKFASQNNYDIFHKTYYSDVGLGLDSKIVSTIHDMTHELFPEYFAKNDGTTETKLNCIKKSDALICVSETTKNDLIKLFGIEPEKLKVIYHGVTLAERSDHQNMIKKPYLLYVGQRWGYKNFNLLLSAYAFDKSLNSGFTLVCFGGGGFNYSERLFIKKHKLENKVLHLSGNDIVLGNLYKYAELFIYTSLYEGFGFPPLEAMEFKCPVLSSPGGSVSEVLRDAAMYFDPVNGEDLLKKINILLNDPNLREAYIKKGKERVKFFTWEKCVSEHYKFYNEILNK